MNNKVLFEDYKQEKFARITRLDINDLPLEEITGRTTSGSINIDGNSNVRRTCSLSMVTEGSTDLEYQWSLSTKFRLEVGLANDIDPSQPAIIWFKQGVYYITSFSASLGTAGQITINLSGKDKMVKLNGELGGKLMQQTQFDILETSYKDNAGREVITTSKIPIKTIIYEAVQQLGGEAAHNIIIKDLDEYGLQLLENKSNEPLYLVRRTDSTEYIEIIPNGTEVDCYENGSQEPKKVSQIDSYDNLLLNGFGEIESNGSIIKFSNSSSATEYYVAKIENSELAGYKQIDLIYPNDLIGNVGETLTSILDKICSFLVVFEYFYDVDGRFIFQKKPYQTNIVQSLMAEDDNNVNYVYAPLMLAEDKITIEDAALLTSLSRAPQINNIANDFSIWGSDPTVHIRYAIDQKPTEYTTLTFTDDDWEVYKKASGMTFESTEDENAAKGRYINNSSVTYTVDGVDGVDWRELIYLMALDWYKGNYLDDFEVRLMSANSWCVNGQTGYEQYYQDMKQFWREIYIGRDANYYLEADIKKGIITSLDTIQEDRQLLDIDTKILIDSQSDYLQEQSHYLYDINGEKYVSNIIGILSQGDTVLIYKNHIIGRANTIQLAPTSDLVLSYSDDANTTFTTAINQGAYWYVPIVIGDSYQADTYYYLDEGVFKLDLNAQVTEGRQYYNRSLRIYEQYSGPWRSDLINDPSQLRFWIDFIDPGRVGSLNDVSVKKIGQRPYAKNEKDVHAIYYRQAPLIAYDFSGEGKQLSGYITVSAQGQESLFKVSTKGNSGLEVVEDLIAQKAFGAESINFAMIPNYDLNVNTKARIKNDELGIDGDYVINRLTVPLDYSGLLQVQCSQAPLTLF